jgi:hypothetical protein
MARVEMNFEVARATGVCAATGRAIKVGDKYVASLVERPGEEGFERLDFDHKEWKLGARPKKPLSLFASWVATMQAPDSKKRTLIDDAALLEIFEQLEGVEEPKRITFRYVLALLLIRKKLLKYEETRRDHMGGRPVMVVKRAASSRSAGIGDCEVVDPGMDEQAVADAVEQLRAIMAGDSIVQGTGA